LRRCGRLMGWRCEASALRGPSSGLTRGPLSTFARAESGPRVEPEGGAVGVAVLWTAAPNLTSHAHIHPSRPRARPEDHFPLSRVLRVALGSSPRAGRCGGILDWQHPNLVRAHIYLHPVLGLDPRTGIKFRAC